MSYTKREWATGNIVGAVDLNRMEDGIANVDVGYSCSEGWVTLTDESVTTTAIGSAVGGKLAYSEPITADTIKVIFNGTEYTCNKQIHELGYVYYGANTLPIGGTIDWTQYPFSIHRANEDNSLMTETAGTYQIEIEVYQKTAETSECFDLARGYSCIDSTTILTSETITSVSV